MSRTPLWVMTPAVPPLVVAARSKFAVAEAAATPVRSEPLPEKLGAVTMPVKLRGGRGLA